MKSSSQTRLQQQQTSGSQKHSKDWAGEVQSDQISKLLNFDLPRLNTNQPLVGGNALFSQFNEKNKVLCQNKNAVKLNSQGSSRSSAQTANTVHNKTGQQQSVQSSLQQLSPRESHTATSVVGPGKTPQNQLVRSSTQEANRRRSLRKDHVGNQSELPNLGQAKGQGSFLTKQSGISPSERVISVRNQGKQLKRGIGSMEGSSSDRLFQQIIKQKDEKQEQNKENIHEESKASDVSKISNSQSQHSSRLPVKLQRSFTSGQHSQLSNNQNDSFTHKSSSSLISANNGTNGAILEKQLKGINKQKELLMKLQREKDELEKQMQANDKMIQNRMQRLHNERKQMEEKLVKASIVIQRYSRGFIARMRFKSLQEAERQMEKQKLNDALNDMDNHIRTCFNVVDYQIEKSVTKIQRAARKMLSRKHFRIALYKLMLLKNIVENKLHKEKMQMLYAFEQMIINTEDEEDQAYYDELYGAEDDYGEEDCAGGGGGGFFQNKQFPQMQRIPIEAEYLSNPSDIIDEEECEDSEEEKEMLRNQEKNPRTLPKSANAVQGRIITKITANDLMEFAGQTSQGVQANDDNQFEIEKDFEIFGNKNLNDTQNSMSNLSTLNVCQKQRKGSEESRNSLNVKSDQGTQYEPPKLYGSRRIQPSQQQNKTKVLALPPPEQTLVKYVPPRPVDMERLKVLSQPKAIPEVPDDFPIVKKKPQKPPMIPGTKKRKNKLKQKKESDGVSEEGKPRKGSKRRRSSRGIANTYERLLIHRESRTALKQKQQQPMLAIDYIPEQQNNKIQPKVAKLPVGIAPKEFKRDKASYQASDIVIMDAKTKQTQVHVKMSEQPSIDETINSSNFDVLSANDEADNYEKEARIYKRLQAEQRMRQKDEEEQRYKQMQQDLFMQEQQQQQEQLQQQRQQQQQQHQDHSLLYKKCFPSQSSLSFKERFPLFVDIIQKYNKNLKHIAGGPTPQQQK